MSQSSLYAVAIVLPATPASEEWPDLMTSAVPLEILLIKNLRGRIIARWVDGWLTLVLCGFWSCLPWRWDHNHSSMNIRSKGNISACTPTSLWLPWRPNQSAWHLKILWMNITASWEVLLWHRYLQGQQKHEWSERLACNTYKHLHLHQKWEIVTMP